MLESTRKGGDMPEEVYDYNVQVQNLTSDDPAIKAAAVARLEAHVAQIRAALAKPDGAQQQKPNIRYAVLTRTVTVETWVPVDTYLTWADGQAHDEPSDQMSDDDIACYEQTLPKSEAVQSLLECAEGALDERITVSCLVDFAEGPESLADC